MLLHNVLYYKTTNTAIILTFTTLKLGNFVRIPLLQTLTIMTLNDGPLSVRYNKS